MQRGIARAMAYFALLLACRWISIEFVTTAPTFYLGMFAMGSLVGEALFSCHEMGRRRTIAFVLALILLVATGMFVADRAVTSNAWQVTKE